MEVQSNKATASIDSLKRHIKQRRANIEIIDERTFRYLPPVLARSALKSCVAISDLVGTPSDFAIQNLDGFSHFSKSAVEGFYSRNNLSAVSDSRGGSGSSQTLSKSILESLVLRSAFQSFLRCLERRDAASLEVLILRLHEALTGQRTGYRRQAVRTRPDKALYTWEFPDHNVIREQMAGFCTFVCESNHLIDLDLVVCSYAYINGLHPFSDGNGRVSRVFANLLINAANSWRRNISFIPFRLMPTNFKGLHGMALRKELVYGIRDDLFELFIQMITLWRDFADARFELFLQKKGM